MCCIDGPDACMLGLLVCCSAEGSLVSRMAAATQRLTKLMAQHKVVEWQLDQEPASADKNLKVCRLFTGGMGDW